MKKNKKILLTLSTIASIAIPFSTIISCSSISWESLGYDFGIAIPPINSLNYVKSNLISKIMPTLLPGIYIKGPGSALRNQLQMPQFKVVKMENIKMDDSKLELPDFKSKKTTFSKLMSDINFYAGNVKIGGNGLAYQSDNAGNLDYMLFSLNGFQKWKGPNTKFNRFIEAQDYIDYVKFCTDINVGSSKIINFQEAKIYGLNEFIEAQKAYAKEYGDSYKYPWGKDLEIKPSSKLLDFDGNSWKKFWQAQNKGDDKYVKDIKNAALKFLLGGMRVSSKSVFGKQNTDTTKTDFFIHYENKTSAWNSAFSFLKHLLPINKEFVDYIGGIENFGSSLEKWQYSSPFDITDISLGQGGFIDLQKDHSWPTSSFTMSDKIKIYFNDDPNIKSALFEDKFISATDIPAIYQTKFWADPNIRQFMTKRNGSGTQALQLNLDKEKNVNSPLLNENFRNAIAHAIDRERLLKLLNWDASFPVTTWTPLGGIIKSNDGRFIDDFLSSEKLQGPYDEKPYSLNTSSWINSTSKQYKFENADRTDNRFNIKVAQKYLEAYKKETGNKGQITLTYLSADPTNLNAAQGIKSMLEESFGGDVKIKIKSVPQNTYETMRTNGEFDLTSFNFDQYGDSLDSYMKRLFLADEIDSQNNKNEGFIDNPSGSWTFYDWFKDHKDDLDNYQSYFFIDQYPNSDENKVWEIVKKVIAIDSRKNREDLITKLEEIWQRKHNIINTPELQFKFISILEKIIALSSPVIPLLDVDNAWQAIRLYGISDTYSYNLQFAYDVYNKPDPKLPGKDVMINER